MLTAMLFDDEKLALKALEIQLKNFENVTVIGLFSTYEKFIKEAQVKCPDIAFIDIETPLKNGLEIAQELQSINARIEVVFVTAHQKYAYDAYEIEASDYILKPVRKERLKRIIDKVEKGRSKQKETQSISIKTLKKFTARNGAGEIINWRTKKVEELLAYFIHHQGQEVSSDSIIEALWPDVDLEPAKKLLYTTIYYLRKILAPYGVEIRINGRKYNLLVEKVECDLDYLQDALDQVSTCHRLPQSLEKSFHLYQGGYLEENAFEWAERKKAELESRFANVILKAVEYLIKHNRLLDAELSLKRLICICPYDEYPYKRLIETYRLMGNRQGIKDAYDAYCKMMYELGVEPEES